MRSALVTLVGIVVISILPITANAQSTAASTIGGVAIGFTLSQALNSLTSGTTKAGDAMCTPVHPECKCGYTMGPKGCQFTGIPTNKYLCPPSAAICVDHTGGSTTIGTCTAPNVCKGASTAGAGGGASSGLGLDKVAGILGQLMGQLMNGSSAAAPAPTTPAATTPTGCTTSTYVTNVVSSDPCAIYVPASNTAITTALGNSSNVTSDLLNALNSGTTPLDALAADSNTSTNIGSSTTDILTQFSTDSSSTASQVTITGSSSSTTVPTVFGQAANLLPGLNGDIAVLGNGATVVVNNRDQANNTEVAGFYGGDSTLGSQPTGIVASWCQSRPWTTNFLSKIIPSSFFDGLCTLRGYTVGSTQTTDSGTAQTQVSITQSASQPVQTTTTAAPSNGVSVPPTVDIWASPATVSLGARTSIFWTSSNAQSCAITSPDGSFTQHSLTGGASTVAITNATVYTISCVSADGSHATKDVTVQLAI